jgi:hypothetical protein
VRAVPSDRQAVRVRVIGFLLVVRAGDPQAGEPATVLALALRRDHARAVGPVIGRPSVAVRGRVIGPTSGAGPASFPPIVPALATGQPDPVSFLPIDPAEGIGWDNALQLATVQAPAVVIASPLCRLRVRIWAGGEGRAGAALHHSGPGSPEARSAQALPTGWGIGRPHCLDWATGVDAPASYRQTVHFRTGAKAFRTA